MHDGEHEDAVEPPVDRRGLIGKLVAGAAGAAATAVLLDSGEVQAAPGFELNADQTSTSNTNLSGPGGVLPWFGPRIGLPVVLSIECTTPGNNALAVRGSDTDDAYAIYGAGAFGVVGIATAANNLPSDPSRGVWGLGNVAGTMGVVAEFVGGPNASGAPLRIVDTGASATAPTGGTHLTGEMSVRQGNLWMCVAGGSPGTWVRIVGPATRGSEARFLDASPTSDGTAPSTGTFAAGEMFESAGAVWLCTVGGTPGVWVHLNPPPPPPPTGNVVTIVPGRVFDTRGGAALTAVEERTVDVSTALDGAALVPPNATGVLFNLTVTDTVGLGFQAIYPAGSTYAGNSSINWTTSGAVIANSGVSKLGPDTSITLRCGAGRAHAIIDVTAYIV